MAYFRVSFAGRRPPPGECNGPSEVYDTDEKGANRKPYGRVFYMKEKSLIFYAYDLDQQHVKGGQSFQAWGRRGPDFKQAVSLGIFYEDNSSKKRWVLKSEDPKTLAQIDVYSSP